MTVILPEDYHAREALIRKKVICISRESALHQDIRPLRIGILNIMPKAETYEFNLVFPLGKTPLQIDPVWIKLKTHKYSSSDKEHMDDLYVFFEQAIAEKHLDGLIVTGAPVEEMEFGDITYWDEIRDILVYARLHIASTLGICWGGLALAKVMGIEKINFAQKLFGVFEGRNISRDHPITGEMDDQFWCPQSRHAGLDDKAMEDAARNGLITLLAHSSEAGYFIFESADRRYLAHLGHPEYGCRRLVEEAERDLKKRRTDVDPPRNFDLKNPLNKWRGHRNEFFAQWIKFVYEQTEF